jgi:hypothetical protein
VLLTGLGEGEDLLGLDVVVVLLLRDGVPGLEHGFVALHGAHLQVHLGEEVRRHRRQHPARHVRGGLEAHPPQHLPLDHLQVAILDLLAHLARSARGLRRRLHLVREPPPHNTAGPVAALLVLITERGGHHREDDERLHSSPRVRRHAYHLYVKGKNRATLSVELSQVRRCITSPPITEILSHFRIFSKEHSPPPLKLPPP